MSSSNYFYRYLLNPVMRGLLRSPLHGITSHIIDIFHFTGGKSLMPADECQWRNRGNKTGGNL